jgi:hypothetical protein
MPRAKPERIGRAMKSVFVVDRKEGWPINSIPRAEFVPAEEYSLIPVTTMIDTSVQQ